MQLKLHKVALLLNVIGALLLIANVAVAQVETTLKDTTPKKRLRSQDIVKGFIGGESHDSYVIRSRRGRTMAVQISWQREGSNRAEFTVSESPNSFSGQRVNFGRRSNDDKRWTGKVPRSGDYYIYVVAHPTAHYTLKVSVK